MGKIPQRPYKVKRNGVWITIQPEPIEYLDKRKENSDTQYKHDNFGKRKGK